MSIRTFLFDVFKNKDAFKAVKSLIQSGTCDVNIQDKWGDTPLHIAIWYGDKEIVRCLISQTDSKANIQNSRGDTALHIAVMKIDIEVVESLISWKDCNANLQNNWGDTPLHIAVKLNSKDIVRSLITQINCGVNLQNNEGYTPFHCAVQKKYIDILRCLIKECDVNVKDLEHSLFSNVNGLQTLHKIAQSNDVELFHVLTNQVNNRLQLVEYILSKNDFQSLLFYIQNGLYINSLTSSGENIIHLLAKFYMDYLYIDFSFLRDNGLDFNLINNDGNSPLMVASLLNNLPFVQFLAALLCDVNKQNHQGHTALQLCVIGFTLIKEKLNMMKAFEYYPRFLACIDTLLDLGADVNMQDINGKTVLMLACMKNDSKLLERLLIHRADVNIVDNHGRSALQYIDLTNNVYDLTCFNLLLSHGCRQSFNQQCLNGNTIIQNVLQFTPLWQIDDIVNFIKFLVFKNVNLQLLTSDDGEISYGQLSLEEFSSKSRHKLRQILYLSGGSFAEIIQILHFNVEENYEVSLPETSRKNPREKFYHFANNLSLKEICRRVIRQNTGLEIHDRISDLLDFPTLTDFLMFKDFDSKLFELPDQLEYVIDDGNNDDDDDDDLVFKDKDSKLFELPDQLEYVIDDGNNDDDDDDDLVFKDKDSKLFELPDQLEYVIDDDYLVYENCKYLNEVHM